VLDIDLPGPGTVVLLGTHEDVVGAVADVLEPGTHRFVWARENVTATGADMITITLHPNRDGKRLLARHHRYGMTLNVTVWATYTPTGGTPRSTTTTVHVLSARNSVGRA
jgi:hypothetical protein